MTLEIEERLKKVSITGRMALGIRCLELNLKDLGLLGYPEMQKMLSDFWEYTSSNRLDIWERKIKEYESYFLMGNVKSNSYEGFENLSKEEAGKCYEIFL